MSYNIIESKPKSYCGIFGIFGSETASIDTYYGLHALQHRGQEASGIITLSKNGDSRKTLNVIRGEGLVSEVFSDFTILSKTLQGNIAIGHNRYSTTGASHSRKNIQPFFVNYRMGNLAIAHNGNLTNERRLRTQLVEDGAIFQTSSDTEVILHLIARSRKNTPLEQIRDALSQIEGAYCLLILTDQGLFAARDPYGFRPLSLGKKGSSLMVASETCAFDINKGEYIREIRPGEIILIDDQSVASGAPFSFDLTDNFPVKKQCIFEFIYFSRPDSKIFGHNVDKVRRRLGKILARNYPVTDPDGEKVIVISVPDSSNTAAIGYASELEKNGISSKFELGLIRSHYIGRTFIAPGQQKREMDVRIKFNVVKGVLENRTVVVIDDSIVRGTTSLQLIQLINEAKPKSVHLRISSPPIMFPCYYGMDFPSHQELIAHKVNGDIEKIREYLNVDSLKYLNTNEMLEAIYEESPDDFCISCFQGQYPTDVDFTFKKEVYENR
ncbi:MAG: amidophosphoribosyltransferase [Ignavibacteriaceae bacterium]|nr:amidophosphoribosyltransferase [Ignavibacteriaceae bacterium]